MENIWTLPRVARLGDREYPIRADFRDVLEIMGYLEDPALPEFIRWEIALALFYDGPVAQAHLQQAMEYLVWFLAGGSRDTGKPGPKRIDWQQDAPAIIADINRVAGQEIRGMPFLHWWTFLSWFYSIGEGQLSMLVTIRDKLRRGKKLEGYEREFYRENKNRVDLPKKYTPQELAEQARLNALLNSTATGE